MNPELINYTKEQLAAGYTPDQVRTALLQAGHDKQMIDQILAAVSQPVVEQESSLPVMTPSSTDPSSALGSDAVVRDTIKYKLYRISLWIFAAYCLSVIPVYYLFSNSDLNLLILILLIRTVVAIVAAVLIFRGGGFPPKSGRLGDARKAILSAVGVILIASSVPIFVLAAFVVMCVSVTALLIFDKIKSV